MEHVDSNVSLSEFLTSVFKIIWMMKMHWSEIFIFANSVSILQRSYYVLFCIQRSIWGFSKA